MKLIRIVKGVFEIVDYDEVTAKRMLEKNPDRYKTIEDFEMIKNQYDKKEKRGRKSKLEIEENDEKEIQDLEVTKFTEEV